MEDLFKGRFVRLAGVDPEEVSKTFAQWNRDSEYKRVLDTDPTRLHSIKATKDWLEKHIQEEPENTYWFAVRALEDDRLLGDIDLAVINWGSRDAFLGIGIGERAFWDKGYGSDALGVMLQYTFLELNLRRVSLNVFEYNQRAVRSYEKAGFKLEGREPQFVPREGRRYDVLHTGLLREEWMEENGTKTNTK